MDVRPDVGVPAEADHACGPVDKEPSFRELAMELREEAVARSAPETSFRRRPAAETVSTHAAAGLGTGAAQPTDRRSAAETGRALAAAGHSHRRRSPVLPGYSP